MCDTIAGDGKRNELSDYVNMNVAKETDILQFWNENSKILPNMFLVACQVLCIPASSAASE